MSTIFSWCLNSHVCCMIIKNAETGIGVQPENQKNKTASHWLLSLPQFKMAILPLGNSEWDWDCELSPPILCCSLVLGLNACTTTTWFLGFYGKLAWPLVWKVCLSTAWSVRPISVAVLISELQASFIYLNTFPFLSKIKKTKAITNIRKTVYSKYNDYLQYI